MRSITRSPRQLQRFGVAGGLIVRCREMFRFLRFQVIANNKVQAMMIFARATFAGPSAAVTLACRL